jgi:ketosteroid isomerase-like protein
MNLVFSPAGRADVTARLFTRPRLLPADYFRSDRRSQTVTNSKQQAEIEKLERAFWKSIADNEPEVATGMLTEPALMVSGHGAMSFDHAGYTRMANDAKYKLLDYDISKMEVLFASDEAAIATYHVHQTMEMDGKPMEMDAVDSSTWVKIGGEWKCAAHTESTAAPKT